MRAVSRLILFVTSITMLTALRARGGCSPELEPLIDLDLAFLSTDLPTQWQADPFRKVAGYAQVPPTVEKFVLGGIVYGDAEHEAVVNGESVVVGDEVGGRVVQSIGRNYVILRKGDSLKELVLAPPEPQEDPDDPDDGGGDRW